MLPNEGDVRGEVIRRFDLAGAHARLVRYRPGCRMPWHTHEWTSVTLLLAGSFVDEVHEGGFESGPLTLLVKPAGTPHQTRVGAEGALTVNFRLGPEVFRGDSVAPGARPACTFQASGSATAALLSLPVLEPRGPRNDGAARLRQLTEGSARARPLPPHSPDLTCGLTPSHEAAREAGMHPVSFARRFRRQTGWSPREWRVRAQVSQAAAALATSRDSIASIAASAGFADQAHLGRLFKRETGLTPHQFRERVHALAKA